MYEYIYAKYHLLIWLGSMNNDRRSTSSYSHLMCSNSPTSLFFKLGSCIVVHSTIQYVIIVNDNLIVISVHIT